MGYEDQSMLCCDFDKLRKELPVQTWTPLGSRIDDLRQIKTEEELEYLARAEEIGAAATVAAPMDLKNILLFIFI